MTPTLLALLTTLGPSVITGLTWAFTHWVSTKSHNATVQALASTAAVAANAAGSAAVQAVAAAGTLNSKTASAAGNAALAAAAGAIMGPPSALAGK